MRKSQLKLFSFIAAIVMVQYLCAQETYVSTGGSSVSSYGSVSYSFGQVFFESKSNSAGKITAGIQQPYVIVDVSSAVETSLSTDQINCKVYPNPSSDFITLNIESSDVNDYQYQLFDITGQQLLVDEFYNSSVTLNMQLYPIGEYILSVSDNRTIIKTFKIIKN